MNWTHYYGSSVFSGDFAFDRWFVNFFFWTYDILTVETLQVEGLITVQSLI